MVLTGADSAQPFTQHPVVRSSLQQLFPFFKTSHIVQESGSLNVKSRSVRISSPLGLDDIPKTDVTATRTARNTSIRGFFEKNKQDDCPAKSSDPCPSGQCKGHTKPARGSKTKRRSLNHRRNDISSRNKPGSDKGQTTIEMYVPKVPVAWISPYTVSRQRYE